MKEGKAWRGPGGGGSFGTGVGGGGGGGGGGVRLGTGVGGRGRVKANWIFQSKPCLRACPCFPWLSDKLVIHQKIRRCRRRRRRLVTFSDVHTVNNQFFKIRFEKDFLNVPDFNDNVQLQLVAWLITTCGFRYAIVISILENDAQVVLGCYFRLYLVP